MPVGCFEQEHQIYDRFSVCILDHFALADTVVVLRQCPRFILLCFREIRAMYIDPATMATLKIQLPVSNLYLLHVTKVGATTETMQRAH